MPEFKATQAKICSMYIKVILYMQATGTMW